MLFTAKRSRILAVTLSLILLLTCVGCDNGEFKKRIADFQQSVGLVSNSVGTYFAEMNQFERDLYLQDVLLKPPRTVVSRNLGAPEKPALFRVTFNEESIRARVDAITLLGRYGQRLAELAGTDAPERFNSAAQELGTNLFNLGTTFNKLAGNGDPTAGNFEGPIGTIVGAIGKMILESKRDNKLRIAINEAAPAVRTVIKQLEEDLSGVVFQQRLTGYSQAVNGLIVFYNCSVDPAFEAGLCPKPAPTLSLEQRRDLLNKINDAANRYELFKANNPVESITSLRDAHEALVKYANDRSPKNLAALVAALDSFRSSAEQVAGAVIKLRDLKRGE